MNRTDNLNRLAQNNDSIKYPSSFLNLYAILDDSLLHDYLHGILHTLLFMRLLGLIDCSNINNNSFLGIVYPVIKVKDKELNLIDDYDYNDDYDYDYLLNTSPSDWINKKVDNLIKKYEENIQVRKTKLNEKDGSLSDVYSKILIIIKFYGNERIESSNDDKRYKNCWETWILEFDVLSNILSRQTPVSCLDSNSNYILLYKFLEMKPRNRIDSVKNNFNSNMFEIISLIDHNKEHIPSIKKSHSINPFNLKLNSLIYSDLYDKNFNLANFINDLDLNISLITGDSRLSQESIEYINTTENGEVIISSDSNSNSNSVSIFNDESTTPRVGDELWKNGYNFLKKMLE